MLKKRFFGQFKGIYFFYNLLLMADSALFLDGSFHLNAGFQPDVAGRGPDEEGVGTRFHKVSASFGIVTPKGLHGNGDGTGC